MKIGLLQCGPIADEMKETVGDYLDMYQSLLSGQDFTWDLWRVYENELPESVEAADAWFLSGSRYGAYEAHDWIAPLEDFIRKAVSAARPVVGVCFGHQIVATALGGKVEKFEGGWNVGRQIYDFGGVKLPLNAWHQDQITELPEGATVLASSESCAYAAVAYGDRALTIQPHPEFGPEVIEVLTDLYAEKVPEELVDKALDTILEPVANEIIGDQIADFFRMDRNTA